MCIRDRLHTDPEQQQTADDLQVGQFQQLDGDEGQHHPQHHGRAGAPENGLFLLVRGSERAASAITTALSPDRMMLIQTILSSPTQKSEP